MIIGVINKMMLKDWELAVSVSEVDVDSRLKFVPQFDEEEPNYVNIGMWFIGVSIIVISSRLLYGKKPFN